MKMILLSTSPFFPSSSSSSRLSFFIFASLFHILYVLLLPLMSFPFPYILPYNFHFLQTLGAPHRFFSLIFSSTTSSYFHSDNLFFLYLFFFFRYCRLLRYTYVLNRSFVCLSIVICISRVRYLPPFFYLYFFFSSSWVSVSYSFVASFFCFYSFYDTLNSDIIVLGKKAKCFYLFLS